ncbi:Tetratricopeptide repeat-containing protein [Mariniphaga anaerophila]|uniref:Tetratricopeptide repeat-containing protein n=2 Tax=Mariniphaga anaerophila TaxID=1484053 RepID=A0A1M4SYJ4_9BACT|nr:Tetratricopeptide repeat-containing protein [Mariniphaga anaerophila]
MSVALVSMVLIGCAQKGLVTKSQNLKDTGKLKEAIENIDKAIDPANEKSEKTINWPRTWEVRGEVYQAVFQSDNKEVKELAKDPLTEALNSYKKALELDEKGRFDNSVKVKLTLLTNDLTNQAVESFNKDDYAKALQSFEQIIDIQNIDVIKKDNPEAVDTVIVFNAGLAAYNAENYDKAIKYYKEAAQYGYNEAKTYSLIANAYQLKKDTLGALTALQEGFEKYPEDNTVLTSMIQIYLDMNKTEDAMKYLDMAISQDPTNSTYYFAQGTLFEKLEKESEAIEAYKNAIENDKTSFNAYYNLGALYYNKGVKQIEVANAVPTSDNEKYEAELKKADEWFSKALPYMEKCHELKADDNMTMESLKNLYYRLKDMENYNKMLEKLGQS